MEKIDILYNKYISEIKLSKINGINKSNSPKDWCIEGWIREVNYLIEETKFSLAYSKIYNNLLNEKYESVYEIKRNIYLKTVMNNIFSFKDKMAYLFYEIIQLSYNKEKYENLSLCKLKCDLEKKLNDNIESIQKEKIKNILDIINDINKVKKEINRDVYTFRNRNTHKWNIGINSYGAGIFTRTRTKINKAKKKHKKRNIVHNDDIQNILDMFEGYEYMETIKPTNDNISFDDLIKNIEYVLKRYDEIILNKINRLSIFLEEG